jgi:hypothetical protein
VTILKTVRLFKVFQRLLLIIAICEQVVEDSSEIISARVSVAENP